MLSSLEEAISLVDDGCLLYLGGAVLRRKPMAFLRALSDAGRRDLRVVTFAGSVDVDLLVGYGMVCSVSSAYVGLGPWGSAPNFRRAVEEGRIEDREYTEWTLVGGLRAAAMGVPFLPTRAGRGSDVVAGLGLSEVTDPYAGGRYVAVRPLRPDVAVVHAWRASPSGAVQMAWPPEHLWDVDVLALRSAGTGIVTVEEVVSEDVICQDPRTTCLAPFEVDAVVECPGGAWPTAAPPGWEEDRETLGAYREASGEVRLLAPREARRT